MMLLEQGDLIDVDFNPAVGHEPQNLRPAVVLSVGYFNNVASSLTVVCPITNTRNGHPLHVAVEPDNVVEGCVCTEQMRVIDFNNPARHVRALDASLDSVTMSHVLSVIGAIFGI